MAAKGPSKPLALDTNLVLDLAGDAEFAHDFKEQFQQRGYTLLLPPMVVAELNEDHLLDVDTDALALAFNDADLAAVHPVHPKALLKALR